MNPQTLLFQFGRQPTLSAAEVAAVLRRERGRAPAVVLGRDFLIVEVPEADSRKLIASLGGVPKIAEVLKRGRWPERGDLADVLAELLLEQFPDGRIEFGLSLLPTEHVHRVNKLGLMVKRRLIDAGRRIRYVTSDKQPLNSATVLHEGLIDDGAELIVARDGDDFHVAHTVAVQPFEALSKRDYGRPNRDPISGMLPPKLAIIMLNLAELDPNELLVDPFCGSGTVLQEAELMGVKRLVGTDVSEQAVKASQDNLRWLRDVYGADSSDVALKLWQMPFKDLPSKIEPGSVGAIVTEPFLGPPIRRSTNPKVITSTVRELSHLYNDFLATARVLLKQGGALVTVVPKFRTGKQTFKDLRLNTEGFKEPELFPASWNVQRRALTYGRPDQHVYRRILVLRKK